MIVVVTRHPALIALLSQRGLIPCSLDVEILSHVDSADQIRGKDVIGILPYHLAAEARSITEIPLALTPEDRGVELSLLRLRDIAGEAVTYGVYRLTGEGCPACGDGTGGFPTMPRVEVLSSRA